MSRVKTRPAKQPTPALEAGARDRAAIAICRNVYGGKCACEKAPSVCPTMRQAALAAISAISTDLAEALLTQERDGLR